MSKMTPGPWNLRIIGGTDSNRYAIEGVGEIITDYAHAAAIAKLPELMEAAKLCIDDWDRMIAEMPGKYSEPAYIKKLRSALGAVEEA